MDSGKAVTQNMIGRQNQGMYTTLRRSHGRWRARPDEAGLDREDAHSGAEEPVAQPFEESIDPAFGGPVHVVALPPRPGLAAVASPVPAVTSGAVK
jgi:hypothetical protein